MRAAAEDKLTITPPAPPRAVDIRRTASRAHRNAPITFTCSTRCKRAASIASSRICVSRTPALLTRPWSGPSVSAAVSNRRTMSASTAMSACTAMARPPPRTILSTTASAPRDVGDSSRTRHSRGLRPSARWRRRCLDCRPSRSSRGGCPRRSRFAARSVEREPEDAPVARPRQHRDVLLAVQLVGHRRRDTRAASGAPTASCR